MFRKTKSKTNVNFGSKESLNSKEGSQSLGSSENLSGSREMLLEAGPNILNKAAQYHVHYLGSLQSFSSVTGSKKIASTQLVDKIEEAQIQGKLPFLPKEDDIVTILISKHGIRLSRREEIIERHPLHTVAQMMAFSDGAGKHNIAVKTGQVGKTTYSCHVFQCQNEEQSQKICLSLSNMFQALMQRS
ncbi:integrin beta-1-binding protein 1 [Lingula anatina]|uniref:Integrin beta-1-binding protein 1 n=1 Tax=Lingula anatina TaxID=7574 RepID=A0A1S3K8B3_LINAN|nr:integrin beta-1-binding protein 1 [Lingula anatina]|eukprot:XP_013418737.1 integrin beta-1-binding protein 1 [Lingula anatina]